MEFLLSTAVCHHSSELIDHLRFARGYYATDASNRETVRRDPTSSNTNPTSIDISIKLCQSITRFSDPTQRAVKFVLHTPFGIHFYCTTQNNTQL